MNTLTFDTYAFVKRLKDVGFSEQQAEVLTELQKTTVSNTLEQAKHDYELDNIATKRDLKELELKLEARIKETELKIEQSKNELTRWIIAAGFFQVVLIAGLILRLADKI